MKIKVVNDSDERLDLAFSGKLDAPGVDVIGTMFTGLINNIGKNVFLDFTEVSYVSSIGLRLLLNGWKMAKRGGFSMLIINTSPEVRSIFNTAGFGQMLD